MDKKVVLDEIIVDKEQYREIPYNYTSYTDKEVVVRLLGNEIWHSIEKLRTERITGQSARMLFDALGDIWAVRRNPYLEDDLINNSNRRELFEESLNRRLNKIRERSNGNVLVLKILEAATGQVEKFKSWLSLTITLREKLSKRLSEFTHKDNIAFDSLSRVANVTDATDWRVEYPLVVLYPDSIEEISPIVMILKELGITIVPRGGATCYAASGIPLDPLSAVVNCEKFDRIGEIKYQKLPGRDDETPTIYTESGAITKAVMDFAEQNDLVFAVDPTSASASCIGGNLAMNAGGKKAVLWGTALDNLVSWQMINANGQLVETSRINHNLGKIHCQEEVTFEVKTFDIKSGKKNKLVNTKTINAPGLKFRKAGLGKDVTDKYLFGIPGIQKEGCDGFVLSTIFILHKLPEHKNTICLEFFGRVDRAVGSIVAIKEFMDSKPKGVLMSGFEHLDARYIKAVGYTCKSDKMRPPRMVLLADIAGDTKEAITDTSHQMINLAKTHGVEGAVEGFIADTPERIAKFWAERAHTSAISKHTNAFKINEDVVIPLPRMGEYSDGIEYLNVVLSLENKLLFASELINFLTSEQLPINTKNSIGRSLENISKLISNDRLNTCKKAALAITKKVFARWQFYLDNLNNNYAEVKERLHKLEVEVVDSADYSLDEQDSLFRVIQYGAIRATWKDELQTPLAEIFHGQTYTPVNLTIDALHKKILKGRIFIAIHMHAGDGNVHTNIPVNSDNAEMIKRAHLAVDDIMALAKKLDGVISGEHGIGITKIKYLTPQELAPYHKYKKEVDPQGVFNRGQLESHDALNLAFTPSFSLIGYESLMLETTALGEISDSIKDCLRCGKCKPVCATHVPRANMLYSPRNKILGTSLLTEAILYEGQTRRGISHAHTDSLNDIAAHCSVCHKCYNPCPVDIDFGDVTANIRSYLRYNRRAKGSLMSWLGMKFLNVSDARIIKTMRIAMITAGYPMQRLGYKAFRYMGITGKSRKKPPSTTGKVPVREQVIQFINRPLPSLPKEVIFKTARTLLDIDDPHVLPIIFDKDKIEERQKQGQEIESVFYFPGCGNERLFSQVGLASQAMMAHAGIQCVLPPTYLCCGYPQLASGYSVESESITTFNRILFGRIAKTISYLEIKTVVVSCGTCIDQLEKYKFSEIFPGSRLIDVHELLMEKGIALPDSQSGESNSQKYLYHEPCHTPIKFYKSKDVINKVMSESIMTTERCCGESGTLAISRPDISNQVRFAKNESIQKCLKDININSVNDKNSKKDKVKILTTCPSCLQGLSRYSADAPIEADYVVVEMANKILGEKWLTNFVEKTKASGIEKVVF